MNLNTLKGQVELILSTHEYTRNSDIALMIEIWKRFYPTLIKTGTTGEQGIWLKDLYDLPREDNIKRMRASFQNDKTDPKYLPTDWAVAKQRGINAQVWRSHLGYAPNSPNPQTV